MRAVGQVQPDPYGGAADIVGTTQLHSIHKGPHGDLVVNFLLLIRCLVPLFYLFI